LEAGVEDDKIGMIERFAEAGVAAAVAAIPGVGGPLSVVTTYALTEMRAARAREFGEAMFQQVDPDRLVASLQEDDRLADLFARAVDSATRTRHRAKRRLMGEVVARASLDRAKIDESELLIWALEQLEAPHFRLLADLHDATSEQAYELSSNYPSPVVATVERVGVAYQNFLDGGTAEGDDGLPHLRVTGLTEFGERLIAYVAAADEALELES
jgi:hypothetical protein